MENVLSQQDQNHAKRKENIKLLIVYGLLFMLLAVIYFFFPDDIKDKPVLTLMAPLFLLVFIFSTKRIFEGLILATVICYFMKFKGGMLQPFIDELYTVLAGDTFTWFLLVVGSLGGFIALLQHVGASAAFAEFVSKRVHSRKGVLLWTMVLGFVIFIDDYLNILVRGTALSPITDKYKVSRAFLAYVLDSSAGIACILIPFSTWGIFISGLLEEFGVAEEGEGFATYFLTIPLNFFPLFATLTLLLAILNVIKPFGPMKKEEQLAAQADKELATQDLQEVVSEMTANNQVQAESGPTPKLSNFILPMVVLVVFTVAFDIDVVVGLIAALVFMFFFYMIRKVISPEDFADVFMEGVKDMVLVLLLMFFSLTFTDGLSEIGCLDYIIDLGIAYSNPATLAFIIFMIFGVTEFVMGLVWTLYIIAFPIVIPIAIGIGADPILTVAAVMSAGVWGSNTCFYVDATILSAQASGITPFKHGITQIPYACISLVPAGICFLVAGFVMN